MTFIVQSYFDTLLRYMLQVAFCGAAVLKVMDQKTLLKGGSVNTGAFSYRRTFRHNIFVFNAMAAKLCRELRILFGSNMKYSDFIDGKYFCSSFLTVSKSLTNRINKFIFSFIWEGIKPPKIKKKTIIGEKHCKGPKND